MSKITLTLSCLPSTNPHRVILDTETAAMKICNHTDKQMLELEALSVLAGNTDLLPVCLRLKHLWSLALTDKTNGAVAGDRLTSEARRL